MATAIAVDAGGYVYVTGMEGGVGYATIKYDPDGNPLWVARYRSSGGGRGTALAVDAKGNVYVTGDSWEIGTQDDYATVKYDADGNQLWAARYNGPANRDDKAFALALDGDGNVYVTGGSYGISSGMDYATIKYDADGHEVWVDRYNGPGNYGDVARALTLDAEGHVYVTGGSWGVDGDPLFISWQDYATIKYDADGNPVWIVRYDGPARQQDAATAIAIDLEANVYVTGVSTGMTGQEYTTIKYSQPKEELRK